jgi:ligand-binding SRPBCC domain-containing protein
MKSYHLIFKQRFPISLNEVWDFFSSPANLEQITPKDMTFEITSTHTSNLKMYPGMIITYNLSPFGGFKLNWMTEITQVSPGKYFIDEQRFGPYKFWHHQHHFEAIDGGVEMTDILTYGLPFGFIGRIAHEVYVRKKLEAIFEFRRKRAEELLGTVIS